MALDIVAGAEFSIDIQLSGSAHLHLLGLFLDVENPHLVEVLNDLRSARKIRAFEILDKLNASGLNLKRDELEEITGEGSAGRPHIAQLLIKNKLVS